MGKVFCTIFLIFVLFFNFLIAQTIPFEKGKKFFENGQSTPLGIDVGMFADTPTRLKIDLAGNWSYTLNNEEWRSVQIPSAYDFVGKVTFQRKFEITNEILDQYSFSLVVYGIHYQSEIQVNGNFVGRHMGGGPSFVLPIRENVLQVGSENVIKVVVDNQLTPSTTLPLRQQVGGRRNYGGIFRDIYILAVPKISVGETYIKSEITIDHKIAKLSIKSIVENNGFELSEESKSKSSLGFIVEIYDKLSDELVVKSTILPVNVEVRKSKEVNVDLQISNPKLWSPDNPDLYLVKCNIVLVEGKDTSPFDEYIFNYGIKDIKLQGSSIILNGKPVYLKGILWQEDHPIFGPALTYEEMEKDIARIRSIGVNLIRFLKPPHPYMINLCDRYGLFVLQEIPLNYTPTPVLEKEFYIDLIQAYVKEMILRDRNNVSVFAWGIGNEFEVSANSYQIISKFVNSIKSLIRNMDTRPVYLSFPVQDIYIDDISKIEYLKEIIDQIDIVSINTFAEYEMSITELRNQLKPWKAQFDEKVLIVGKYGKEIEPKNRNGYSDPISLESQAWFAWHAYNEIKELNFSGSVLWSFNDWRGDRPALTTPSGNPFLHTMGMMSFDRERRIIFDVMRSVFNSEKVSALPVGNYSSGAPVIYVVAGLIVLISLAFFYNSNRRFRENINRSLLRTYNFFADVRDQRIIPISHSVFFSALIAVTIAIVCSSILSHYRYNILVDNLLSQLISDNIKEWLVKLIWSQYSFIAYFSVIFFILTLVLTLIVKLFSLFVRQRVYLYHAYSITIWSTVPMIILIPFSMVLFRLMQDPFYILPSLCFVFLISLWSLFRLFKGVSIIFDIAPVKVYTLGIFIILVVSGLFYGYVDYNYSTSIYIKYFLEINNISL